jgi:hypothetical protein
MQADPGIAQQAGHLLQREEINFSKPGNSSIVGERSSPHDTQFTFLDFLCAVWFCRGIK